MGKAQFVSEAGFTDRGSAPPFRVADNARGFAFASFPSGASNFDKVVQGGKCDKLGLFWAWKVKLEQLKGEVERALQCVYEGLELFGPGSKDWIINEKATILKPKPKSKPKKAVKLRAIKLVHKLKPNSKRLGLATYHGSEHKPKIQSNNVGLFPRLDEGCRALSFPSLVFPSPDVVLLLASAYEDV
jgi:hypothetical protein